MHWLNNHCSSEILGCTSCLIDASMFQARHSNMATHPNTFWRTILYFAMFAIVQSHKKILQYIIASIPLSRYLSNHSFLWWAIFCGIYNIIICQWICMYCNRRNHRWVNWTVFIPLLCGSLPLYRQTFHCI